MSCNSDGADIDAQDELPHRRHRVPLLYRGGHPQHGRFPPGQRRNGDSRQARLMSEHVTGMRIAYLLAFSTAFAAWRWASRSMPSPAMKILISRCSR